MRFSFRMPLRFVRGHYGRLALTIVALALGVALVCAIDLVNRAVLRAFVEVIDTMAGRAALQVTAGEGGLFPEEVAATVGAVPGVELAVPVVTASAFTADDTGEMLTVHGVEITNEAAVRAYEARDAGGLELEDPLVFLNQSDSVVLTHAFAQRRGLHSGSQITLDTPTGRHVFTVRGLLEPQGVARVYAGNLAVMDLYAAEAVFARPGFVSRVDVVVERDAAVERVARAIEASLPEGLRVEAPSQRQADLHKVMQSLQVLLHGMGLVGLVAAFLIAFNRLSTVFELRVWQLGVLRATGFRRWALWWELIKESLLLGAAGAALGVPLGIGLGRLMLPIIATTTALNYKLVAPEATFSVRPVSLALAILLGLSAAVLAAVLPAWRAARVSVAETIRGRGREQQQTSAHAAWLVRGLLVAGLAAALGLQGATRAATWGLVATGLIAIGTAMAARPVLALLGSSALAVMARRAGRTGRVALAIISQNPRRSGLTVAMVGVGLGAVLWLGVIAHSFQRSAVDALGQAMRADLIVSSAHVAAGYLEMPVDDRLAAELRGVPGVEDVIGVRVTDWQYRGGPIALDAFDPAYFTDPRFGEWPLVGQRVADVWPQVARGDAVVVSSNFVANVGARVGDTITLETPSGPLSVRVAGVTVDFASPRGTIEMSRELYKRHWHDPQVTRFFVRTIHGTEITAVRSAIAQTLGKRHALRILSSGELLEYFATQVRRAFAPVDVLAVMTLFVVLVGMSDTLAAGVIERTRDIGVMRAVGMQRRDLGRMVILEGLILGVFGVVLAIVAGLSLGTLWVETTFPYLLGWALNLEIPYGQAAVTGLVTLAVCSAAAILPALQAARLEPAAALRCE